MEFLKLNFGSGVMLPVPVWTLKRLFFAFYRFESQPHPVKINVD
jgi:hypothetical protein